VSLTSNRRESLIPCLEGRIGAECYSLRTYGSYLR
jgi:hypothetical protein